MKRLENILVEQLSNAVRCSPLRPIAVLQELIMIGSDCDVRTAEKRTQNSFQCYRKYARAAALVNCTAGADLMCGERECRVHTLSRSRSHSKRRINSLIRMHKFIASGVSPALAFAVSQFCGRKIISQSLIALADTFCENHNELEKETAEADRERSPHSID